MGFGNEGMRMEKRHRLREAAGSYWLLDMEQDGKHYKPPIELNESAAKIWELADGGAGVEEIAAYLSGQYGISRAEAAEDTRQFLEGLRAAGF